MKLPWIQVSTQVLEVDAPELATRLEVHEDTALACLVRLFGGMLARADESKPPSASDTIFGSGPVPARILSSLARFGGDPGTFSDALQSLVRPVVEPVEGGLRVRGLDRYDPAWGKNRPIEWAEWKRNHPKPGGGGGRRRSSAAPTEPEPGLHRNGTGPEPARSRNGTGSEQLRDRPKTGPQDQDQDKETNQCDSAGAVEPWLVGKEEKPNPTNQPTNEHPDLELEERWTIFEGLAAWQLARVGLGKEQVPTKVVARFKRLLPHYSAPQWRGCFERYLDPKLSEGSSFAPTWPLAKLLTDGVLANKMPDAPPRGFLCHQCRQPANELKTPEGRAICYPCFARTQAIAR